VDATEFATVELVSFYAQCRWVKKKSSGEYVAGFEITGFPREFPRSQEDDSNCSAANRLRVWRNSTCTMGMAGGLLRDPTRSPARGHAFTVRDFISMAQNILAGIVGFLHVAFTLSVTPAHLSIDEAIYHMIVRDFPSNGLGCSLGTRSFLQKKCFINFFGYDGGIATGIHICSQCSGKNSSEAYCYFRAQPVLSMPG